MIDVLARHGVGQKTRAGQPLRDRPDHCCAGTRKPPLTRPIARPAGVGLADMLHVKEAGRAVVELLADLLADADARPAATGTRLVGIGQIVFDLLAWQVRRQRLAAEASL